MSAPGPVPQDTTRRRNKPKFEQTLVPALAYSGEAPLLPNSDRYSDRTIAWYETYRTCEQAGTFSRTGWQTLWDLADLMDAYYTNPTASSWAQISKTLSGFMALPADQRRLNWKIEAPKIETVKSVRTVAILDDRRSRLASDVS
jgi:hypothetical protein